MGKDGEKEGKKDDKEEDKKEGKREDTKDDKKETEAGEEAAPAQLLLQKGSPGSDEEKRKEVLVAKALGEEKEEEEHSCKDECGDLDEEAAEDACKKIFKSDCETELKKADSVEAFEKMIDQIGDALKDTGRWPSEQVDACEACHKKQVAAETKKEKEDKKDDKKEGKKDD